MAAFARMKVDDSKKILPNAHYPTWVVFTEQQKLSTFLLSPVCLNVSMVALIFMHVGIFVYTEVDAFLHVILLFGLQQFVFSNCS